MGHRTTARGALFLLIATATIAAAVAAALTPATAAAPSHDPVGAGEQPVAPAQSAAVPQIVFPLIGKTQFTDDFGDARGNGPHQGNDIVVPRRSPVVAAENGQVTWWTTSARAGCMLYLHGDSGTTYLYVHLNNDRTLSNDNKGGCRERLTYTAADGSAVTAGEQIAWSGDSGDADGNPHLHFEVHPGDGDAVSPFAYLEAATHTLFPARVGSPGAAGLRGSALSWGSDQVTLSVAAVRWWPGGRWIPVEPRVVVVSLDAGTAVVPPDAAAPDPVVARSGGASVVLFTRRAPVGLEQLLGDPLSLTAARVNVALAPAS